MEGCVLHLPLHVSIHMHENKTHCFYEGWWWVVGVGVYTPSPSPCSNRCKITCIVKCSWVCGGGRGGGVVV